MNIASVTLPNYPCCGGHHSHAQGPFQGDVTLQQQSPVDLVDPIQVNLGERDLQLGWAKAGQIAGRSHQGHHGRSVSLDTQADRHYIQLDRKNFKLDSLHFHQQSEHTVEGKPYPMELHLVHRDVQSGNLAVMGIFIDEDKNDPHTPDEPLDKFLDQIAGGGSDADVNLDPAVFIPSSPDQFYRYEGSLTTPNYDSNVSWLVMREPLKVDSEQMTKMKALFENPARPTQPLNRRFILSTFAG